MHKGDGAPSPLFYRISLKYLYTVGLLNPQILASSDTFMFPAAYDGSVRSGSCQYCSSYTKYSWGSYCARNHSVDLRSYIEYECDKAIEAGIKIVVLYNAGRVDKNKCPQALRNYGNHVPMWYWNDGSYHWDYQAIKNAIQ